MDNNRETTEYQAPSGERSGASQLRIYPNGPILVRGDVQVVDEDGVPISRRRRVLALCRCGHSAISPLCDGTHKLIPAFMKRRRTRTSPEGPPVINE